MNSPDIHTLPSRVDACGLLSTICDVWIIFVFIILLFIIGSSFIIEFRDQGFEV